MKKILLFIFIISNYAFSQTYDCVGAIKICDTTYTLTTLPLDTSDLFNEINPFNSCLAQGEVKGTWYKFGFTSSGTLSFLITPIDTTVDFDWAVYKLDWRNCSEIWGNDSLLIGCSFAGIGGGYYVTGATGNPIQGQEPTIAVTSPALYYLYITTSIYDTAATQGYTIDFSGTTASFVPCAQIGINENDDLYVKIYPNPANEIIQIETKEKIDYVNIYSIEGKLIQTEKSKNINVSHFSNGSYILEIHSGEKVSRKRIVKN